MLTYLKALVGSKVKNERGQGMVEYGLIIAVIAVVVVAGLVIVGEKLYNPDATVNSVVEEIIEKLK